MNYPDPIRLEETVSTNSYLADLCRKASVTELTSVYTDFQTAGRGQRGNSWESEAGKNLLFSFVVYPDFLEARRQFFLSQVTAIALQEVLSQYAKDITIKWPNDIYWRDKKLCGTLIENDLTGMYISRSISGTGVNLNQARFTSDAPNPVSLFQITGQQYDRQEILRQIMERIVHYYALLKSGETSELTTRYQAALYRKHGFHAYKDNNGIFRGRFCEVEPSGRLILEDEAGLQRAYMFKEVTFLIPPYDTDK
ncbi:biotin--[acetyl-CoA-carboxylase] ligase [Phocaeicola faecium]|uniref:Biotin--[acetyl-CoA-carboxylase] ligase n=1 Tax=Phocaeicola faecium TaxID=2762213 RepID=A0ABR8VD97_9BACT|nr:biotin--[acetyl-CoA-carboxylase] ligase [Phocaeicola faecium]MBD8002762.1 biotin--[acetyl-CoA-carboxylase] ligase [Phocaeicola faecium]